jgi:ribosomal protein S1
MSLVGQELSFMVIGIDKKNNLFIGSRSRAMERLSSAAWDKLESGQTKAAIARRIIRRSKPDGTVNDIGLYVEIDGIEAFLPVQELSYGWVGDISSQIQPGDVFDVKITGVDKEKQRLDLSVKSLYPDPWPGCADRYAKNAIYVGTVTGIAEYGIFADFEPGVNTLCKHPKSGKLNKGDKVAVLITRITPEDKKINGVITRVVRRK